MLMQSDDPMGKAQPMMLSSKANLVGHWNVWSVNLFSCLTQK